jgi:hypothetical protein
MGNPDRETIKLLRSKKLGLNGSLHLIATKPLSQLHAQHVVLLYMLYEVTENEKAWQLSKELRASGNPDLIQGAACVDAIWNKQ